MNRCLAIGASAALLLTGGCIAPTAVDFDRTALKQLETYECFAIDSREARADPENVILSPIVDRRIERAIRKQLLADGFTEDCPSPDFRVSFRTVTKTRTEIDDLGSGLSPFRRFPYHGYSRYPWLEIDQYEEGTFVIDIVDADTDALVWRGAYTRRLGWSAPSDEAVAEIVGAILAAFPPGRSD